MSALAALIIGARIGSESELLSLRDEIALQTSTKSSDSASGAGKTGALERASAISFVLPSLHEREKL